MISKIYKFLRGDKRRNFLGAHSPIMISGVRHNNVLIETTRVGSSTTFVGKENLILHENVFIGQYNFIESSNGIEIGEGCQITNFISVLTHSSHDTIRLYGKEYQNHSDLKAYLKGPVKIGKYSFIGPHVTIMPNTKIGKGSIVSAYSLVQGDYPDFSVISGNPATVIGSTKDRDSKWLKENPDLERYYQSWAGKD